MVSPVSAVSAFHRDKFAQFAARKTREAVTAQLPPYTTALDLHPPHSVAIGNAWSRRIFDGDFYQSEPPAGVPACSLVFVQSRNGNTGARNPSDLGGGETDKHLIYEGLSRVAADAVLGGANTVRGGQMIFSVWHPELVSLRAALGLPRHPVQVIATLQGLDLRGALLFNVPDVAVILLTVGACSRLMHEDLHDRPWISIIELPAADALADGFAQLRGRGISRISAIGGRGLARQLIDGGLAQDLYLTTSPIEAGEENTPLYPMPIPGEVVVRKHGSAAEIGVVFEHYLFHRLSSRRHEDPRSTR